MCANIIFTRDINPNVGCAKRKQIERKKKEKNIETIVKEVRDYWFSFLSKYIILFTFECY